MNYNKSKLLKLPIISERFLSVLLKVLVSEFTLSKKSLGNIERLFDIIDIDFYNKDLNINAFIQSIKLITEHKMKNPQIDKNQLMTEIEVILTETFDKQKKNLIFPIILNSVTIESEVKMVNNAIENYLKYATIILSKEKLYNTLINISSGDIINIQNSVDEYRNIINSISEEFKRSDNIDNNQIIHSTDEDYYDIILESYDSIKNPQFSLSTGLKMFNTMLSEQGGFLIPSYVIIYASINSFKSALLQYCAEWVRNYNSDKFLKKYQETGKIPCILKYSFENSRKEDAQREFIIRTGKQLKDIKNNEELKIEWDKATKNNSIIDVATVYAESGTVKVSDMRKQRRVLWDLGYNVFMAVIDYLELIRPEDEDFKLEKRLQLGAISNSLHVWALSDEMLILTAQQMNRAAETAMADLRQKSEANIIKNIAGRQFVGESYAIDKPADLSLYIALERSIYDGKLYLTIKRDKCRYKRTDLDYIAHPLTVGNFYLEPDFNTDKILSVTELTDSNKKVSNVTNIKVKEFQGNLGSSEIRSVVNNIIKDNTTYKDLDKYLDNDWKYSKVIKIDDDTHFFELSL
jgi:replicative DNA helicase